MDARPYFQRNIKVSSARLRQDDIVRLFHIVDSQLKKSVCLQMQSFAGDPAQKDVFSQRVKEAFLINYRINKPDGDSYAGNGMPAFSGDTFPEFIQSIFISTRIPFEVRANFPPNNFLRIFLDFQRPSLAINFLTMPSNPTANDSEIVIEGENESWVIETYHKINDLFKTKTSAPSFIHSSGIYDAYLYLLVFPIYLYLLWRVRIFLPTEPIEETIVALIGIYLYSILLVGLVGRLSFQYARWLYPLLEYESDSKRKSIEFQRYTIFTVITGLAIALLYDILKTLVA